MNPVFPPIIRGIQDAAEALGYSIITANTDDDKTRELDALRMMQGRSIEGVLVATAQREDELVDECIKNNIPFVLVNRTIDAPGVNAVIPDEKFGIQSALDHLIGLGHRKIAHIAGPVHTSTGFSRAREFSDYMHSQDLQADMSIPTNKFTVEEGLQSVSHVDDQGWGTYRHSRRQRPDCPGVHGCSCRDGTQGSPGYIHRG